MALNSSCCINHGNTDITILNGAYRTNHRVVLKIFLYLTSFANPCGIYEVKAEAKLIILRIDGVSRGTGYIGYNVSLLPDKGIDKRRLTGIGATYHGKAREFLLCFTLVLLGKRVYDSVQKISGTGAIDSTNGIGIPQAESVKLSTLVANLECIRLISNQKNRLLGTSKQPRDLPIQVGHPGHYIHNEEDYIGLFYCYLYLLIYLGLENILTAGDPSSRINDGELVPRPVGMPILTVARCS